MQDLAITTQIPSANASFRNSNKYITQLIDHNKEKYKNSKITMSGHSLGGTKVMFAMQDKNISSRIHESHIFNPGPYHGRQPAHSHIHLNKNDPISMAQNIYNTGATIHHHKTHDHGVLVRHNPFESHWNHHKYWEHYAAGVPDEFDPNDINDADKYTYKP